MDTTAQLPAQPATTFTATLVSARIEENDAIHLHVSDPADPLTSCTVILPAGGVAYARFVEQIGLPSFEGAMLLYGAARLTVAGGLPLARCGVAVALVFDAVGEAPPGPVRPRARAA